MASLFRTKEYQSQTDAGDPLNGGLLYFYTTTTTTAKNTYPTEADANAGTNANVNPIVLDSDGRSPVEIWISGRYRLITKTSAGVTIADDDPIEDVVTGSDAQDGSPTYGGNNSGTANALAFSFSPTLTAYTNGQILRGRITADNSTAVTVNCDGLGAKSLVKQDGIALQPGDLQGPGQIAFSYDSATDVLRLQSPDGHLFRNGRNEPARVDVPDGATVDLSPATINSRYARLITSTTAITAITLPDGNVCNVLFNTARTLTHGASLILPGAASITTAAGDTATFIGESAGVVRCIQYTQTNGLPFGQIDTQTFTANGTWTKPTGTTRIEVECVGGGGGGGGAAAADDSRGGGGGAGGYSFSNITSPTSPITVTVGAAGTGSAGGNVDGGDGGTSSFGSYTSAAGGSGGQGAGSPEGAPGGAGGSSTSTAAIGRILSDGTQGQAGQATVGGAGARTDWGAGGAGGTNGGGTTGDGVAAAATSYGAGGGGGRGETTGADPAAGGAGAGGIVIVRSYWI